MLSISPRLAPCTSVHASQKEAGMRRQAAVNKAAFCGTCTGTKWTQQACVVEPGSSQRV